MTDRRSTEHGFEPLGRSAEHGFTLSSRSAEHGFTLLEMLVALAVFSLAALALIRLQGVTIRTAADLDRKVVGQIVARNLMVEWQSDPTAPGLGKAEGDVRNGGRNWHWRRETVRMDDPRLLRIDLIVTPPDSGSSSVLTFVRDAP